jgi:hypothetical protein
MPEAVLDIPVHHMPIESGKAIPEVTRGGISQFRIGAGFFELIEERWQLTQVMRIGHLADQICRPHQFWIIGRILVLAIIRGREIRFAIRFATSIDPEP